jgi:hypothetical protein
MLDVLMNVQFLTKKYVLVPKMLATVAVLTFAPGNKLPCRVKLQIMFSLDIPLWSNL